jgi:hypothetical protein
MEPLSAFTLSLAILNIILNTISQFYNTVDKIVMYKDKMMKFKRTLDDCSISYQLWYDIWERKGNVDVTFQKFFGLTGWVEVKGSKDAVERYIDRLRRTLCLKPELKEQSDASEGVNVAPTSHPSKRSPFKRLQYKIWRGSSETGAEDTAVAETQPPETTETSQDPESQAWSRYTDTISKDSQAKPDTGLVKRLIGILGPNDRLDRLVVDLKEEIDRLHRLSTNHYRRMGFGKEQPKQAEDVEFALDSFNFWEFASIFCETDSPFRQNNDSPNSRWYLQLHFSRNITDCKTLLNRIVTNCNFIFTPNTISSDGNNFAKEVRLVQLEGSFKLNQNPQGDLGRALQELFSSGKCNFKLPSSKGYQMKAFKEPSIWTKNWQDILNAGVQHIEYQTFFELERARLALGFALWMVLLWDTTWFSHVCSRSFRCVLFQETGQSNAPGRSEVKYRQENVYLAPKVLANTGSPNGQLIAPGTTAPATTTTTIIAPATTAPMNTAPTSEADGHLNQLDDCGPGPVQLSCMHEVTTQNKLEILGRLLAELLLGKPIDPNQVWTDVYWEVESRVPGDIPNAVYFCFKNSEMDNWITASAKLSIGQIDKLVDNVIKPLQKYYETIRDNTPDEYAGLIYNAALSMEDDSFDVLVDAEEQL